MSGSKTITIKWQRLVSEGETCPRCTSTGEELDKAVKILEKTLTPLSIRVSLIKEEIPVSDFQNDPMVSNRIWINNRLLEDYLNAGTGQSQCCDICGDSKCRTIEADGRVYEAVPSDLIVKAGISAASELIVKKGGKTCCG